MRVLAFLATILVTAGLALGAGLLIALQFRDAPDGILVAAAAASPVLVIGPLSVGSWAASFDHRTPGGGSRYLGRAFVVVVLVDAVAAGVVVVASAAARAPLWVPVVLVGGSAVLLAVARPIGGRIRRLDPPIVDLRDQVLPSSYVIRRKVVAIGLTFGVAALVSAAGVAVVNVLLHSRPVEAVSTVLLAGQLTFLATAMAALVVALPFGRLLRDAGGRDVDRLRRYAKVVLRGKDLPIAQDEQPGVVRYAQLVQLVLQFNTAYSTLLCVSVAFQFVSGILRGDLVVFSFVFLVLIAGLFVWAIPLTMRRIRRARRYVADHPPAGHTVTTEELAS